MDRTLNDLLLQLKTAMGQEPADLIVDNVQVVNVYTERVEPGVLVIKKGKVVAVNPNHSLPGPVVDGQGQYAVPGFMDAHVHIETTLLTPEALGALVVPHGTTALFVDPMEIANVAGTEGLRLLLKNDRHLPYRLYLEVPSRVPTAPGLETTGGVLGPAEVRQLMDWEAAVSLGELDPAKVLGLKIEYLEKVLTAHGKGKVANGHAIGLGWNELNCYAAAGLNDDHECVLFEELLERVALGMTVFIREGSTERNLDALIKGVIEHRLNVEHLAFCTDDKHANDINREGHINYNVNRAIALGLDPVKAIKIASLNCARHFRLDHRLGSLTPGRWADFMLTESLTHIQPTAVYKAGVLVAENGKLVQPVPPADYRGLYDTVKLSPSFSPACFRVTCPREEAAVRVINIYPDQIINYGTIETMKAREGLLAADPGRDLAKLAVVERYGKNGSVGLAFVKGFGLKAGALAISVSHDHHNITVVGVSDTDMYLAAKELERHGGGAVVVRDGQVLGLLPLPVGGLMSDRPAEEVMGAMDALNGKAGKLGCSLPAPFMSLSFISLPTVPELGLTDQGLIDVKDHKLIPLIIP
ncbi:MAG TPA: adenine deaminase [Clostridia bacterium]|nr:adenine deaminase [Clostridia bacterium]